MFTIAPDSDPLDTLAREHVAGVFRYLRSLVGDPEEARDLVQETFLRLGRHAARKGGAQVIGAGLVFTTLHYGPHVRTRPPATASIAPTP